jgi:hypothetical protein
MKAGWTRKYSGWPAPLLWEKERKWLEAQDKKVIKRERPSEWAAKFQSKLSAWIRGSGSDLSETLGYSRDDLLSHLERQFDRRMSWDNYAGNCKFGSKRVWVVDHIVPKSAFDESELVEAFSLTNLRPCWMAKNMQKGAKREFLI